MRHLLPYKYVEAIAKAGSIRKAAELLAITPSALNRRLLSIEEELGVQIFERLPVGVRLNVAGEILLEHIRNQMSDLERVKSQIADLSGQRRGDVSIAASPEIIGGFLPNQVYEYANAFPGVNFDVHQVFRSDVEQVLTEYRSDIALIFEPLKLNEFQNSYNVRQPMLCVMHKDHPLADKKEVRLYECAEFPMVLPDISWGIRYMLEQGAIRLGLQLRCAVQSDNRNFLRNYKREADQLDFSIPINTPSNLEERGQVAVPVNVSDVPNGFIFLGHLKGRTLPVASARFLEQLTTNLAERFEHYNA